MYNSGVRGLSVVGPPILAFMAGAGVCSVLGPKLFGAPLPHTITNPAWKDAEAKYFLAVPREGAPDSPVALNPFRNHLPATYKPTA